MPAHDLIGQMNHVVVAPDKFKGTLTAAQVAAHVAAGLGRARPGLTIVQVPVADGGDGTVDAAEAAGFRRVEIGVRGPDAREADRARPRRRGLHRRRRGAGHRARRQAPGLLGGRTPAGRGGAGPAGPRRRLPAQGPGRHRGDRGHRRGQPAARAAWRRRGLRAAEGRLLAGCRVPRGRPRALGGRGRAVVRLREAGRAWRRGGGRPRLRGARLPPRHHAARHRADAGPAVVRRPAVRRAPGHHRRGRARHPDAARQGPGRGGPRDRRGRTGPAGGGGGGRVFTNPRPAPLGGHRACLHPRRHRARPGPLPRAGRPPARGTGRAHRPRLALALTRRQPPHLAYLTGSPAGAGVAAGQISWATSRRGGEPIANYPGRKSPSAPAPAAPEITSPGPRERHRIWSTAIVIVAYFGLSIIPYWGFWTAGGTRIAGKGGDLPTDAWFLDWVAYALVHLHNPLVTDWGNYPYGVNGVTNLSMPLLGVLGTPVTLAFGAFVTTTLFFTLAFPLSALSGYVLMRRWVRWRPAAFAGGLLYGFSPYLVAHGGSHLNLVFVPLPPLIFGVLCHIASDRPHRAWPSGAALALLCVAQFLISAEILVSTVIVGAFGLAIAAAVNRDAARHRWKDAAAAVGIASAITAVLLAYPLWLLTAGPARVSGPVQETSLYRGNLLAPLIPDSSLQFKAAGWLPLANTFSGTTSENGLYTGLLLLVVLIAGAIALRHRPAMKVAALTTIAAFVMSLGSRLTVGRYVWTAVPLPEAALTHLPVLDNTIAARYSLYVMLGAAMIFALTIEALRERLRRDGRHPERAVAAACAALACLALLPLVPAWPYWTRIAQVPRYFSSALVTAVPPGSVAVLYPFPAAGDAIPMLWQVAADMRFKSPGGRFLIPAPGSVGTTASDEQTLTGQTLGRLASGQTPALTPALRQALRDQLRSWEVRAVLVQSAGRDQRLVRPDARGLARRAQSKMAMDPGQYGLLSFLRN